MTFHGIEPVALNVAQAKQAITKSAAAVRAAAEKLEDPAKSTLAAAAEAFGARAASKSFGILFAKEIQAAIKLVRTALATADSELTEKQEEALTALEETCASRISDEQESAAGRTWVIENTPTFILIDEYPDLPGKQNIAEYLHRKQKGNPTAADEAFEKLCKVADLDPEKLQGLLNEQDAETRNQLVNRAGALVTKEIRRLWKDRPLKVRFNIDGSHFETLISDPNAVYDVEVNLEDRSRGFQWFFAFYIVFAADTQDGDASDAVLLLDEPGLYLHAKSQSDLLGHFEDDFDNQILYSTHSPFMVPTQALDSVRTVNIAEDSGTTVSNDPAGDSKTLFPLQAALGYDLAQSLFVGPNNLVVEGVTDFWILSAVSAHLADSGKTGLVSDIVMTPAGGAQKVSYMVALLASQSLKVLVLLDAEKDAKATKEDLLKNRLIRDQNVVFVSEAFATPPAEADIEDLLEAGVYEALVKESYAKELKGKKLVLNPHIPRVAKRVEHAFEELGIAFHKTRPTRLFLTKMSSDPASVLSSGAIAQFEALFVLINGRLAKLVERGGKPFQ